MEFRRAGAARGGVRRTSPQSAEAGRGISTSIEKISRRSCEPLLCQETSQTAIVDKGFPTAATGSPLTQSNKAEMSSTSVLPFLNEQLPAERGGQMFMHQ